MTHLLQWCHSRVAINARHAAGVCVVLLASIAHADAQGVNDVRAGPSHCPTSMCALEIDRGPFQRATIRRADGVSAHIGFTGSSVVRFVDGVPDAMDEAKDGRSHARRRNAAALVGLTAVGISAIALSQTNSGKAILISLSSLVVALATSVSLRSEARQSDQAFDRAVWLYNRSLRDPATPVRTRPAE